MGRREADIRQRNIVVTAWAIAMAGAPVPDLLDSVLLLDSAEACGTEHEVLDYERSMQGVAATNQVLAGFAALARAEANQLVYAVDDNSYTFFRTLREACRVANASDGTSRAQAALERLELIAATPVAMARVQHLEERYGNGIE